MERANETQSGEHDSKKSLTSRRKFLAAAGAGAGYGFAGCVGGGDSGSGGTPTATESEDISTTTGSEGGPATTGGQTGSTTAGNMSTTGSATLSPELDLSEIEPDDPVGPGPTGTDPQPTSTLNLSDQEVPQIEEQNMTVSVVFQYLKSDWIRLVRRGLQNQFTRLGVQVEGVYGVDFETERQVSLLETLRARASQIDAVIIYPVDPTALVEPIRALREEGVEVVILTNTPPELKHGEDFAGMVTVDNYGLGLIAGRIIRELVGEGKVGMIEQASQLYVIDERERAVRDVFSDADSLEVVSNSFNDANETYDLVQNMLTANPDMQAIWTPWATPPANEGVAAINDQGADDVIHTTVDLNEQQAEIMAQDGVTKGLGAGDPYGIGANLVKMAAHAVLGNETPAYVGVGTNAVVRGNLLEMYEQILRREPPESITRHYEN